VPEEFWGIHCAIAKGGAAAVFEWSRGRLFDRAACTVLYELCMADPTAVVTAVQEREKRKWRPLPLNTVALQTLASRKLGISSDVAMTIAEELYNKGILSYPRTETENFKEVLA
jgi:DNA topoisomerase-3